MKHIKLDIQRFAASGSISCTVLSQSTTANTSNVRITFTVTRTGGSTHWDDAKTVTIHCDGQTGYTSVALPSSKTTNSCYVDFNNIQHNADGTKSISFDASVTTGTGAGTITASGSATLNTIPRYFSGPIGLSVVSMTETSVTYRWTTTETCNWVRYHFDNSSGWHDVFDGSATSGTFTVYNGDSLYGGGTGTVSITAGSSHSVYVDCRRADSGLWSNSGAVGFTSYDYPKPTTSPDFIIGNSLTINVYNPLGRQYTLQLISNVDGTVLNTYTGNINGNVTGFADSTTTNKMYETIPNNPSGTYYAKVVCSETGSTKTKGNGTYTIKPSDCSPEMSVVGYEDINATTLVLTGDDQVLINNYSTIQVTVPANGKATAKKYASIKGYKIENGSYISPEIIPEVDGEDVVLTCPATSGIIKVWAIDTRDQTDTYEIANVTLIDYTPLEKSIDPIAERCDSSGTPNGVGEYVKITLYGKYWNDTFGDVTNSIQTATYQYKNNKSAGDPTTGTTVLTPTTSNDTFSISQLIVGDIPNTGFEVANTYSIWVTVTDRLSSATFLMTLTSGTPHIAYSPNGVSIMGMYDESVGGLLQVGGQPISGGGDTLPINSIFDYDGSTVPSGYEEVLDYSTNEIDTHTEWYDGKTIYRKVVHAQNITNTSAEVNIASGITNVGTVISIRGSGVLNVLPNYRIPIGFYNHNSQQGFYCFFNSSTNDFAVRTSWALNDAYIIMDYTKAS